MVEKVGISTLCMLQYMADLSLSLAVKPNIPTPHQSTHSERRVTGSALSLLPVQGNIENWPKCFCHENNEVLSLR